MMEGKKEIELLEQLNKKLETIEHLLENLVKIQFCDVGCRYQFDLQILDKSLTEISAGLFERHRIRNLNLNSKGFSHR